ncbi:hypothetical protein ACQPYK_28700 [Streptosporangium sp. CA-135522]|uniref:hypothetical protein n=1 Tax=Streptosporangium sp. CA-135522 TaxID=3240072 RepID=UPI003D8A2D66
MRNLVAAPVVTAVVDPAQLSTLADPITSGPQDCPYCGQAVAGDATATVVMLRFADGLCLVRIAHPRCAPSAIFPVESDLAELRRRMPQAETPISARPALIPIPGGDDLPMLVIYPHDRIASPAQGGHTVRSGDLMMIDGLQMASGSADGMPRQAPDWQVTVAAGQATVIAPNGAIVYTGELAVWPSWRRAATANGWVWLCVGMVGLGEGEDLVGALRAATAAGMLATGWVTVTLGRAR